MPITVISTSGSVRHMRPLPSDSKTAIVPVSATAKFAPLTATRASRNFRRRCRRATSASAAGSSLSSVTPSSRMKISRISARFRWIAGTRMCDDQSWSSWMINSARSVSIAAMPAPASASFSSISSVASDLTFTTSVAPWPAASAMTIEFASAASRAQWTVPPRCLHRLLELDQIGVEVAQRAVLDRLPRRAQLLPVRQLLDRAGALVADRRAWRA